MLKLTSKAVVDVMYYCLYNNDEVAAVRAAGETVPPGAVLVEGVTSTFGLHPERLAESKPKIAEFISQLPDTFLDTAGGGWSFLNLPFDKDGNQWCEHREAEALCALAIGVGLAKWAARRDQWHLLPGGMPYITFFVEA